MRSIGTIDGVRQYERRIEPEVVGSRSGLLELKAQMAGRFAD